ncbi:peptidyl-prolyl cis-trans isomerase B (cyclophilin B) [Nakamurella panacisegetis]|uniref:Peptidyl-prolyl cis-trans isomerase n=1 Tax=Nakamurella panacisegetis TaxID=1090615 RepID=A0A1H0HSX6_9ACTN|nr:peptidylprolyl isomerase [Nakamurella panacisegetis]SDO22315.1 peptidyl-prolyl cis-trans isomerase B (cyclophilin B) [Nakamurella panacisegetis]
MRPIRHAVAAVLSLLLVTSCASNSGSTSNRAVAASTSAASSSSPAGAGATCSYPSDGSTPAKAVTPPAASEPNSGTVDATISLTQGEVKIAMNRATTPCTIGSFVHLATTGYFDDTKCHRLTTSTSLQVLQCGDPTGTGSGTPGYSFADETNSSMTYPAGTVAMANAGPDTNGSQFFLVYAKSQLPPDYTVFGKITSGLDVLTKIAAAGVTGGGTDGAPSSAVTITKITVHS